jgi:hypothetical protein
MEGSARRNAARDMFSRDSHLSDLSLRLGQSHAARGATVARRGDKIGEKERP